MNKYLTVMLALALMGGAAHAAVDGGGTRPLKTASDGELSPALKPLSFFEGHWKVDEKMVAMPNMDAQHKDGAMAGDKNASQKEFEKHGTFNVTRALGGTALVGEYEAESTKGKRFFGHLVLSAEQQRGESAKESKDTGKLTSYWADSHGMACFTRNVTWQDNKLTIESPDMMGEGKGKARVMYSKRDDDHMDFAIEIESTNGWSKMGTGTYTRMDRAR
jgi:hypothetical protein